MSDRSPLLERIMPGLKRYAVAVVAALPAIAITVNTPLLASRPYLASLCAVVVSAWIGGFGPALLCAAITFFSINAVLVSRGFVWNTLAAVLAISFAIASVGVALYGRRRTRRVVETSRQGAELHAIFGQASVGIAVVGLDHRLTRVNRRLAEIVGHPPEVMEALTWERLSHPDDWITLEAPLRDVFEGRRGTFTFDQRLLRGDESTVWVHVSIALLLDRQHHPEGLIAVVEDIHEQKAAEERLRVSEVSRREIEERARLALDIAHLGTWTWEPATGRLSADQRTREICGFPDGELVADDVIVRTHPDDRSRVEHVLGTAARHDGEYGEEFRFVHADGSIRWVVARGQVALRRGAGAAPQRMMLGSVLDVTERRLAEEALKQADRQKDDFLALLAHELRNPLAPIRTAVELLKLRGGADEDGRRIHAVIERQVQHLARLVDDLLDVSRVLRGKVDLRLEEVDIGEVVAVAVETARPLIDAQRQELRVQLPETALLVHGDQVRLSQVVANLLNNASKYTPRGGTIVLTASAEGDEAVLRVTDTGTGIAPELLPTIFEPFVQADRSLERVQGGLGIGLTLVKKIVDLHGGIVGAHSGGASHGSEFTVRLPILRGSLRVDAVRRQAPAAAATAKLRLLVVDDNVDAADSLAMLLTAMGHTVVVSHDGLDAVAQVEEMSPDVVLLDIGLPGKNGYEVAAELRRRPAAQPGLIAITGYGQAADARRAAESGFDAHLIKPVDLPALEAALARYLTARESASRIG